MTGVLEGGTGRRRERLVVEPALTRPPREAGRRIDGMGRRARRHPLSRQSQSAWQCCEGVVMTIEGSLTARMGEVARTPPRNGRLRLERGEGNYGNWDTLNFTAPPAIRSGTMF